MLVGAVIGLSLPPRPSNPYIAVPAAALAGAAFKHALRLYRRSRGEGTNSRQASR